MSRNAVGDDDEAACRAFFILEVADNVNNLSLLESGFRDVFRVEKDDAPTVADSAIAIIEAVDGRVELIVAANRHHQELSIFERVARERVHCKLRASGRGLETTLTRSVGKIKTSRLTHALIVIFKTWNSARDCGANQVIVSGQREPINVASLAQRRRSEARNDHRLAQQFR